MDHFCDLKNNETGRFMALVKELKEGVTKNGNPYVSATLFDGDKKVPVKFWKTTLASFGHSEGDIISTEVTRSDYNGLPGYNGGAARKAAPEDDLSALVKRSENDPEEMFGEVIRILAAHGGQDEGSMLGHLYLGAEMVELEDRERPCMYDEKRVLLLKHIIASHHGEKEMGAIKCPVCLEAFIVHNLDMLDFQVDAYMGAYNDKSAPGEWTAKCFALGNAALYQKVAKNTPASKSPFCGVGGGMNWPVACRTEKS